MLAPIRNQHHGNAQMQPHLDERVPLKETVVLVANLEEGSLLQDVNGNVGLWLDSTRSPLGVSHICYTGRRRDTCCSTKIGAPACVGRLYLTEGVATPQGILVPVVLRHADVASTLLEVKGGLNQVAVMLKTELSSAGGDGNCEWVDDEALALPQIHLQIWCQRLAEGRGHNDGAAAAQSVSCTCCFHFIATQVERLTYVELESSDSSWKVCLHICNHKPLNLRCRICLRSTRVAQQDCHHTMRACTS